MISGQRKSLHRFINLHSMADMHVNIKVFCREFPAVLLARRSLLWRGLAVMLGSMSSAEVVVTSEYISISIKVTAISYRNETNSFESRKLFSVGPWYSFEARSTSRNVLQNLGNDDDLATKVHEIEFTRRTATMNSLRNTKSKSKQCDY
jgi:hypothetical protein